LNSERLSEIYMAKRRKMPGYSRSAIIVGGSLTGLAAAIRLARAGLEVMVLERSPDFSPSFGTGIGVDRGQLSAVTGVSAFGTPDHPELPVVRRPWQSTSWSALQNWLRRIAEQLENVRLIGGQTVTDIRLDEVIPRVVTTDHQYTANLVIGADGYRSVVRQLVAPDLPDAIYAGYGLWRGTIAEADMPAGVSFDRRRKKGDLWTDRYRLVSYEIPGPNGEVTPGHRTINWVWYDPDCTSIFEMSGCVEDKIVKRSLLRHELTPALIHRLEKLAKANWPEPWRGMILGTLDIRNVFATPIAEYVPVRLVRGPLVLLGDAAHVAVPATGAGLYTGLEDVEALGRIMEAGSEDLETALNHYETIRIGPAQDLGLSSREWSESYLARINQRAAV
jgi:2-polyprenyl-6-methoxyphenol hydroxylase-like FAD-dependent oxidoreductase